MRLRFVIITEKAGERMASVLDAILSATAIAFGHTFIIKYLHPDAAGSFEYSKEDVVFVFGSDERIASLFDQFAAVAREVHYDPPQEEDGFSALRIGRMAHGCIVCVNKAVEEETASMLQNRYGSVPRDEISALSLVQRMMRTPQLLDVCVFGKHEAEYAIALADEISGGADMRFLHAVSNRHRVYGITPYRKEFSENDAPYGVLMSIVHLLRSLQLEKEAECILTATNNAVASGWRTRKQNIHHLQMTDAVHIGDLIRNQIELVGELISELNEN